MRYVSLFSGIEAATVAWEPLGWEPVAFSEVDPFCCEVLKHRFPEVPNLGDVTKIDWSGYVGAVDLVVGGSPCQSFSVAGRREGLAGESGLMYEYIRAVRELSPAYFVWENVPGAFSSEEGEAFRQLLNEMDELGYGIAWRVLDAQFFGVAQRRRRVFVVGVLGDVAAPAEVLFEPEGLEWDLPSCKDKRKELADAARSGDGGADGMDEGFVGLRCNVSGSSGADRVQAVCMASGQANAEVGYDVCPTIAARQHKDPPIVIDRAAYNQGRNAKYDPHIEATETMDTLVARGPHAVCCTQYGPEIAGTLAARHDGSPCADRGPNVVCFAQNTRDEVRLVGGDGSMTGALCANPGVKQQNYVMQAAEIDHGAVWRWPWIVRRLTPRECERLQGFPDDWTRIPYRGKPAEQCPDGPRYSALGNSMAVPVMRWIGERIARVDSSLGLAG